jgi:hypothetical protein
MVDFGYFFCLSFRILPELMRFAFEEFKVEVFNAHLLKVVWYFGCTINYIGELIGKQELGILKIKGELPQLQ